jgi:polysaccharide biosynthesis protein PslG
LLLVAALVMALPSGFGLGYLGSAAVATPRSVTPVAASRSAPAALTPTATIVPSPSHTTRHPPPSPTLKKPQAPEPSHPVGVADPDLVGETAAAQAAQLTTMRAIGISSLRFDANWDSVQYGGPTSFDWAKLDQAVDSTRAAGMSVDLIIDGCPPWAALAGTAGGLSPVPASAGQYAEFAAAVARRYGPKGVGTFEIWNEPNSAAFWPPKANPAAYTADLKAAYSAIKEVDPSAFVISGGLAPELSDGTNISPVDFLTAVYADGAKGSFDAVGYHAYCYPALPDTYESWSGWSQMAQASPSVRSVMDANGDSSKSIWITEFGAPTSGPDGVGEASQAAGIAQAVADAKGTTWIGALYLYSWQDTGTDLGDDGDWFGLVTAGGAPKLAYTAVAAALK